MLSHISISTNTYIYIYFTLNMPTFSTACVDQRLFANSNASQNLKSISFLDQKYSFDQ